MPNIKISVPADSAIKVKKGDKIKKGDVLAVGEDKGELKITDLAGLLKVKPHEVSKNLLKNVGSQIKDGEKLAYKKGVLGLSTRVVLSGTTGRIELIDGNKGLVGIREKGNEVKITTPIAGKVSDILDNYIEIEVGENAFVGKYGKGENVEGELINFDTPDKIIQDKIVLIEKLSRLNLARMLGLGALGIITLSGAYKEDLWEEFKEKGFKISYLEIEQEVFKELGKHMGKKVLLAPLENLIFIL